MKKIPYDDARDQRPSQCLRVLSFAHMVVNRGRVVEAVERVYADGVVCSDLERWRTIAACTRSAIRSYQIRNAQRWRCRARYSRPSSVRPDGERLVYAVGAGGRVADIEPAIALTALVSTGADDRSERRLRTGAKMETQDGRLTNARPRRRGLALPMTTLLLRRE